MRHINKKISWGVIIGLVLLLGAIDCSLYLKKKDNSEEINRHKIDDLEDDFINSIAQNTINTIDKTKAQDPKNWKVYKENKYGVEFNYPSYYQINKAPDFVTQKSEEFEVFITFSHFNEEFVSNIMFIISKDKIENIFDSFVSDIDEQPKIEKMPDYTLYKATRKSGNDIVYITIIDDGSTRFIISGIDNEVLEKILSTLKLN